MLFLNEIKKLKYKTKKESKWQMKRPKKNTINGWLTFPVTRIGFHKETLSFSLLSCLLMIAQQIYHIGKVLGESLVAS